MMDDDEVAGGRLVDLVQKGSKERDAEVVGEAIDDDVVTGDECGRIRVAIHAIAAHGECRDQDDRN